MVPKFTLVPSELFSEDTGRQMLSEVVLLSKEEPLSFVPVPSCDSVLLYSGDRPAVYEMLMSLVKISEYNKVIVRHDRGVVYIVVAQGDRLCFCNAFSAEHFSSAEYFLFAVLKKLQINPEITTPYFTSSLSREDTMSLLRYFKNVEVLK